MKIEFKLFNLIPAVMFAVAAGLWIYVVSFAIKFDMGQITVMRVFWLEILAVFFLAIGGMMIWKD